ncbi:MAG: flagellar biosynthesis protein FlhB [Clostridiales Family XIII bacterium]|jgi:flagellar biosynthetic protein FlhB|nr:flagellar biosynthesis protein FlhB [Clostridiales Family XIII bacterium]
MAESNKTERATAKKRRDERKKGNVFKSKDAVSVVTLLVGFWLTVQLGSFITEHVTELFKTLMNYAGSLSSLSIAQGGVIGRQVLSVVFITTGPIMAAMFVIAIVANGVQTKFLVAGDLLKFKANRINPIQGIKRLFSVRSLVELLKSVMKITVVIWLVYSTVMEMMTVSSDLLNANMDEGVRYMAEKIRAMVYIVCLIFAGVAILDYAYQKYDYEKKLRMSKQEVKDEFKQTEGDPMVKGKRREKQREISMSRMMQQVPEADVVVRNPTHFAVAMKYDIDKDPAPIVVAKGQDRVAERIIRVAEQNGILMTENPPLARSLYEAVAVNDYVPADFYHAVAEVMAWVYETKKSKADTEGTDQE